MSTRSNMKCPKDGAFSTCLSTFMMTRLFALSLLSFFYFANSVFALSWTVSPFNPSAVPLAVRSPYLSAWLLQGAGNALNGDWAKFWTGTVRTVDLMGFRYIKKFSLRSLDGRGM